MKMSPKEHMHGVLQVIIPLGDTPDRRSGRDPQQDARDHPIKGEIRECLTGEHVCIRKAPDLQQLKKDLEAALNTGIKSLAVVLKHAAIFPDHEQEVGKLARELGFKQISLSSDVMQMVKMVPRGFTATADAYLTPRIMQCVP